MKKSRSQKKAELQEASEKLFERLLDWEEKNKRPNLSMMEEEILSIRKAFGEELLRVAIEGQESRQPVEPIKCAGCGEKMSNKGDKARAGSSNTKRCFIRVMPIRLPSISLWRPPPTPPPPKR